MDELLELAFAEPSDVEMEDALKSEGIYVWGPDGERFERMFAVIMNLRREAALRALTPTGADHDL